MTFKVEAAELNFPQTLEAVQAEPAAVALTAGLARGLDASAAVSHTLTREMLLSIRRPGWMEGNQKVFEL